MLMQNSYFPQSSNQLKSKCLIKLFRILYLERWWQSLRVPLYPNISWEAILQMIPWYIDIKYCIQSLTLILAAQGHKWSSFLKSKPLPFLSEQIHKFFLVTNNWMSNAYVVNLSTLHYAREYMCSIFNPNSCSQVSKRALMFWKANC